MPAHRPKCPIRTPHKQTKKHDQTTQSPGRAKPPQLACQSNPRTRAHQMALELRQVITHLTMGVGEDVRTRLGHARAWICIKALGVVGLVVLYFILGFFCFFAVLCCAVFLFCASRFAFWSVTGVHATPHHTPTLISVSTSVSNSASAPNSNTNAHKDVRNPFY